MINRKKNDRKASKSSLLTSSRKLIKASAFIVSFAYIIVFVASALLLLNIIENRVRSVFSEYLISAIEAEEHDLRGVYNRGGIEVLTATILDRLKAHENVQYLLVDQKQAVIIGNLPFWPKDFQLSQNNILSDNEGVFFFKDSTGAARKSVVRKLLLPNGEGLLVGRDLDKMESLTKLIRDASEYAIILAVVLGCTGGFFIAMRVLSRIDTMSEDTIDIMNNNLVGRLTVTGSGDEIDRLAESINNMLDQIEELVSGIKQVSDNIAHDLKTPLTRLRNKAAEALTLSSSTDELRDALEYVIEESDSLIKIFNALLMIARMEAGHISDNMTSFDAANVVTDVAELYEALAEDEGIDFITNIEQGLYIVGNRELLGQAIANLLDNALKYGRPRTGSTIKPLIQVSASYQSDHAVIAVADKGKGIADKDKEVVFKRFSRLETARTQPGFGLGLNLVAAVASLHDGYVILDDNNPGLIVKLVIPLQDDPVIDVNKDI